MGTLDNYIRIYQPPCWRYYIGLRLMSYLLRYLYEPVTICNPGHHVIHLLDPTLHQIKIELPQSVQPAV
jgi:hypothetical protein